ncbi:MAG TPA: tyrosinase family protein, partial [Candidatus Angelobacter sp.]|nr:tyrosinase family protein [Candidatus Angelobacter sp.]
GRAFFTAGEVIESNPHNNVHVDIGGLMGSPLTAAQDPVFYVHTANIDRLWNLWLAQGGGMRNDPLFLDAWKNNSYTFFDENGREVHMTGCDVMRCAEQLNYTYEGEPPQVNQYCPKPLPALSTEVNLLVEGPSVKLTGQPVSVSIDLAPIQQRLPKLLKSADSFIALNFRMQAEREPGAVWEVYLGLPADEPASSNSPCFLGTASLYSRGVLSHSSGQASFQAFLFPAARALSAAIKPNQSRVLVRFVPSGPLIDGKPSPPKVLPPVRCGPVNLSLASAREPD